MVHGPNICNTAVVLASQGPTADLALQMTASGSDLLLWLCMLAHTVHVTCLSLDTLKVQLTQGESYGKVCLLVLTLVFNIVCVACLCR